MSKRTLLIGFEVRRHVRKMSFWIMSAAVPLLSLALLALVQLSGGAIIKSSTLEPGSGYNFLYHDSSNHIDSSLASRIGGTRIYDIEAAKEAVRHGTANTLIAYPDVLTAAPIQIYENNRGLVGNQLSTALATQLLQRSTAPKIANPELSVAATGSVKVERVGYRNGQVDSGITGLLPQLACLVLFAISSIFVGNQLVSSFAEEREQKIRELLFVEASPTDVFVAKLLATASIAGIQLAIMIVPMVVALIVFGPQLGIPVLTNGSLSIEPAQAIISILTLVLGLTMTVAVHGLLGVRAPSVRAAAPGQTFLMLMMVSPLYMFGAISEEPGSFPVQAMSVFPFTAPLTTLLRAVSGGVPISQFTIAGILMALVGAVSVAAAVGHYSGRPALGRLRRTIGHGQRPRGAMGAADQRDRH